MKDPCSSVSKLLEKYFDRETTEKDRFFVESHLQGCPACQNMLKQMEGIRGLISLPAEEAVKEEEFEGVWQRIRRRIQTREEPAWRKYFRAWLDLSFVFQRKVLIPAVAAAAILVFVTASVFFKKAPFSPGLSVVEFVESQRYNVMVYESEKPKVTVIWLFEKSEQGAPS